MAGKEDDEVLTNDWWGLHAGDDFDAREKRRPKEVNMRKGVDLHTAYITTRDGVKVGYVNTYMRLLLLRMIHRQTNRHLLFALTFNLQHTFFISYVLLLTAFICLVAEIGKPHRTSARPKYMIEAMYWGEA